MSELAQVNVSLLRAPLRHTTMKDFGEAYDAVARVAEDSPGFIWHRRSDDGHTVKDETGQLLLVNVSAWQNYESLHEFVYRSSHARLMLRRGDWFLATPQPSAALWWQADGERPTIEQALARLRHLRDHGPMPQAFSLTRQFTPDGGPAGSVRRSGPVRS